MGTDPCSVARLCVEALNAQDFDALHALLAEDVVYTDPSEQTIEGRGDFLLALRRISETIRGFALQVDNFSRQGDGCLLTGSVMADDPQYRTSSLWEMGVQGSRLVSVHAYRRNNTLPLVQIVRAETASVGG